MADHVPPAAVPASRPRTAEPSPIAGIRVSEEDGILSARVSRTGRVLWKSTREGEPLDAFDVLMEKSGKPMDPEEDRWEEKSSTASTGRHLVIDALTGLRTWSVLSGYVGDGPARPFFHLVGAAAGRILVEGLTLLDPADGRTLATLSAPLTEEDAAAALASPPGWGGRGGVPATAWPLKWLGLTVTGDSRRSSRVPW
ncbi:MULTISPECIES: hypothetical protein [unclassified Streptosporangium]|uniref:hypothetical protein n=1 Tax=unclassified Streptosporangium TaxID=2632669 RepID=UPI002E285014|nr:MULTISPECIES: hypothetical protein [unclassified Streptosporangium]